jgi:hypothetical protein
MKTLLFAVGLLTMVGCENVSTPSSQPAKVRTLPITELPADTSTNGLPLQRQTPNATWSAIGVTMQGYSALKTGDSYEKSVSLLGEEGTEISSNDIGGTHTIMYQWKASNGNMNATFQNGKLVSKAQFGLK